MFIVLSLQFAFYLIHIQVELFDALVLHACETGPSNDQSAENCDVLPALNLLCQWMAGSSPNTWNGDILKNTK